MEAGRELDALVAEKVMGWYVEHVPPIDSDDIWVTRFYRGSGDAAHLSGRRTISDLVSAVPHYSTDIAAARRVVNAMAERGYWCQLRNPFEKYGKGDYWAGFTPHSTTGWNGTPDHWTPAESMELAICLAALETMKAEADS